MYYVRRSLPPNDSVRACQASMTAFRYARRLFLPVVGASRFASLREPWRKEGRVGRHHYAEKGGASGRGGESDKVAVNARNAHRWDAAHVTGLSRSPIIRRIARFVYLARQGGLDY